MTAESTLHDLSADELYGYRGGDWWERMMGAMIAFAFFGGALAAPELVLVSLMFGGSILGIETLLTWY